AAAEALGQARLLTEGTVPAAESYWFTALPPQAARQTACRLLGEEITPQLLPPEELNAFSTR
ncbi:MAG TPA: hypothetical protein DCP22_07065, partial [Ruminococcaceae bacterium]|nr:hypothetical protein [Oscillospiraceae bacterium]